MTVAVVVPDGMEPGQQMSVDPDGPEGPLPPVLVTIPEGMSAGQTMQVEIANWTHFSRTFCALFCSVFAHVLSLSDFLVAFWWQITVPAPIVAAPIQVILLYCFCRFEVYLRSFHAKTAQCSHCNIPLPFCGLTQLSKILSSFLALFSWNSD